MYNKVSRTDLLGDQRENFTYDSIYRMVGSEKTMGASIVRLSTYDFDSAGNRTVVGGDAAPGNYVLDAADPAPARIHGWYPVECAVDFDEIKV